MRILCKQITSEKGKDCEEKLTGRIDLESELITCPQPLQDFCYGPLSCKYYSLGPVRAVPYKGVSGASMCVYDTSSGMDIEEAEDIRI